MAAPAAEVDAVLIGVGLVGTVLGRELTRAGLKVVGLERGEPRHTVPDFQAPEIHDELRYAVRKKGFGRINIQAKTERGQHPAHPRSVGIVSLDMPYAQ